LSQADVGREIGVWWRLALWLRNVDGC